MEFFVRELVLLFLMRLMVIHGQSDTSCTSYTSTSDKKCTSASTPVAADEDACKTACNADVTCLAFYYETSTCNLCTDATAIDGPGLTLKTREGCITVACTETDMTITEYYDDFGVSPHSFYVTPSSCPTATATTLGTDDQTITVSFTTNSACLQKGDGTISVSVIMSYSGVHFTTAQDKAGIATCTFETTHAYTVVPIGTFTSVDVTLSSGTFALDVSSSTSLKMYKYKNQETPVEVDESSNVVNFIKDTLCVTLETTSAAADINIQTMTFSSNSDGSGTTYNYIVDYCTDTSNSIYNLFEIADWAVTCVVDQKQTNCPKRRAVCFRPWLFNGETNLYVAATVTFESAAGLRTPECTSPSKSIGRKRRDNSEENPIVLRSPLPISPFWESKTESKPNCEESNYFIATVSMSAAVVFSGIVAVFSVYVSCKQKERINTVA